MAVAVERRGGEYAVTICLIVLAATSWRISVWVARGMSQSGMNVALVPFLLGWLAMMTAVMLPAVAPVVRLFSRAAALGRVAPTSWRDLGTPSGPAVQAS